ncbi:MULTISPECIES: hypothetical protein [Acidaminococcus]|uniref:hypothetical protein n=1 Tax=Acidaminococcus TaxID=904 RepID=UPI000E749EB6|nr:MULTISPECIES: hypothetical protein [Acidaminococcus]RJU38962.1 hypothetical protein DW817_00010 [Acidaminococcus sp. AM33-14BH]
MAHADLYYREIINNGKEACSGKNSKNTELTIRFIGAVYDHVFVNKHVLSDGYRTFGKSCDMAVSFQWLLTNQSTKADLVLLRHEHIESAIEKRYN